MYGLGHFEKKIGALWGGDSYVKDSIYYIPEDIITQSGFPQTSQKCFLYDRSMTVSRLSMFLSLLKFCIHDILQKMLENADFLN